MTLSAIVNFLLHFDKYLIPFLKNYGPATYLVLFLLIFIETGIVIMPFLPGDSLLFIAGAVAASGGLNFLLLFVILSFAAISGDSLNYWIGKSFSKWVIESRLVRKKYIDKTELFYEKHGGKTVALARFFPIIRTFAPFVAGMGEMEYKKFFSFNVIGALSWVVLFLTAGYYFGNIPFIKNNLTILVYLLIIVSLIPVVYQFIREKYRTK